MRFLNIFVHSCAPVFWFLVKICDCNDDELVLGRFIDDAVREALHLTAANRAA